MDKFAVWLAGLEKVWLPWFSSISPTVCVKLQPVTAIDLHRASRMAPRLALPKKFKNVDNTPVFGEQKGICSRRVDRHVICMYVHYDYMLICWRNQHLFSSFSPFNYHVWAHTATACPGGGLPFNLHSRPVPGCVTLFIRWHVSRANPQGQRGSRSLRRSSRLGNASFHCYHLNPLVHIGCRGTGPEPAPAVASLDGCSKARDIFRSNHINRDNSFCAIGSREAVLAGVAWGLVPLPVRMADGMPKTILRGSLPSSLDSLLTQTSSMLLTDFRYGGCGSSLPNHPSALYMFQHREAFTQCGQEAQEDGPINNSLHCHRM